MMLHYYKITLIAWILSISFSCSFPEDRKDNPNNEPVIHTGNAMDSFDVNSTSSSTLTAADSARMVYNDDSSTSGTPSGRGTMETGKAVGTGTSAAGEKYPNSRSSSDSLR